MIERLDWKTQILPEYPEMRKSLIAKYDSESPIRKDGLIEEAMGGYRFASTLTLALNRTKDPQVARSIYQALETIVDRPRAGETAWEMRRFIRRAATELIGEFGVLMQELAEVSPGQVWLEMDDFMWDIDYKDGDKELLSREQLDALKSRIQEYKSEPA